MLRRTLPVAVTVACALALPALAATAAKVDIPEKVTYAGEIATVLHENCASCHRAGDIAPMSLLTYDEARPWARSILKAVEAGDMPPWHANPEHGHFKNDRRLDDRERALIERWVELGAPAGDLSEAPAPPDFSGGWRLGEPDLVVTFDSVEVPADGPDVFRDLIADTTEDGDRWIRAIEVLPEDRRVVHHVIIYATDGQGPPSSGWLGAWAAGMEPMVFPEGTAKLLKKGSKLVADMHYHPAGEAATDATRIGVHFYDGEPDKELINLWVQNSSFEIPAGAANHEVRSSHTFHEDATVHSLLPHMHYRGKDFTYTATYPDGRTETLLEVDGYDFNWQTIYELSEPHKMPKGTRIDCVAHYDNSADNPFNPDPTKNVTFGNESFDEMMIGFVDYTVDGARSPATTEEQIAAFRDELVESGAQVVYDVELRDDDNTIVTVLQLPADGEGLWFVPANGQVIEGKLQEIARDGRDLTAKLNTPIGILAVEATVEGDTISGIVKMGAEVLQFTGSSIH